MEQNRSEPIKFQKNGWTGTKSSRKKIELWIKISFFPEVSRAFVPVRMLSANQIAEKSQYEF